MLKRAEVRSALAVIPLPDNTGHTVWIKGGYALCAADRNWPGFGGRELFIDWTLANSHPASTKPGRADEQYSKLEESRTTTLTIGPVFELALAHGWKGWRDISGDTNREPDPTPAPSKTSGGGRGRGFATEQNGTPIWQAEIRRRFTTPSDAHCSDVAALARLIELYSERVLIAVQGNEPADIYAVDELGLFDLALPHSLVIASGVAYMRRIFMELADRKAEAARCLKDALRMHDSTVMARMRKIAPGMITHLAEVGALPPDLTVVQKSQVDADLWHIGTPGGVLNLLSGETLPPAEARKTFTVSCIPCEYTPGARHWLVDQIIPPPDALLPDSIELYRARVIAHAMTHGVEREFILELCEAGSGKTTFSNTLQKSLPPYVTVVDASAVEKPRWAAGPTGHNDEVGKFGKPTRIAFMLEFAGQANRPLLKKLSGGDDVVYRPIREKPVSITPTGLLWIQGNKPEPGGEKVYLGLGGSGDDGVAIRDRAKVLHRNRIPDAVQRRGYRDWPLRQDAEGVLFRRAAVARVVAYCMRWADGGWPCDIPSIADAAEAARIRELPAWKRDWLPRALVPAPDDYPGAPRPVVYRAYLAWHEDNGDGKPATKTAVAQAIHEHYQITDTDVWATVNGKQQRVYAGYRQTGDGG